MTINFFSYFNNFSKTTAMLIAVVFMALSCANNHINSEESDNQKNIVNSWLTKGDGSVKLKKQNSISLTNSNSDLPVIEINKNQKYQSIDGFGYTLTGGSVEVINQLSKDKRKALLQEIYGKNDNTISVNYIRLSIGASDLNSEVFSYDDVPNGQTDEDLSEFSLAKDQALIEMLKDILTINPNIKIMATPWSAPVWMKDNGSSIGGSLKPEYYSVYAQYFVKYVQAMKSQGITIDAITPQNEPLHPGNNPSLYMTSGQQKEFIKNHLGPAFKKAGISTKIVAYDHNCNKPEYPMDVLSDPQAYAYTDGSAFHLYEGDVSALSTVHNAYPNKNLYFTEQWTGSKGDFEGDLNWHLKNVIIGTMRNWSKTALEWNLANDPQFNPHTPGGCTECKGALTIDSVGNITRNVGYYIVAHASKFVPTNSVRIASTETPELSTAAFLTPENKVVLLVQNDASSIQKFNIKIENQFAEVSIPQRSVMTFVFQK